MNRLTPEDVTKILEFVWKLLPDSALTTALRIAFELAERIAKGERWEDMVQDPILLAKYPDLQLEKTDLLADAVLNADPKVP